ncbi:hypothetical protein P9139_19195 [Curtobacterium flaccumfaciens]|nr:hypothetical protein P9139_19195 [Curtobacterium flaccumfaciens]
MVSGAARSVGFTAYNTIAFADVEQTDMTRRTRSPPRCSRPRRASAWRSPPW